MKNPRTLRLRELKTLGVEATARELQCSGNGRGLFPGKPSGKPSGKPWSVGAAGCVVSGGAPVRWVADALGGALPSTRFLTGTGGAKLPEGIDPASAIVEHSVPARAMTDARWPGR